MAAPVSACPACIAAPLAEERAGNGAGSGYAGDGREARRIILSLPAIHCAACIAGVEAGLSRQPGVRQARVNLTLKRVTIEADPGTSPKALAEYLTGLGYEAYELDPSQISAQGLDKRGRDLLMRLGVAGFAMMNVMLLSISVWSGATDATRDLFHWVSAAIALPAIAFSGQVFFRSAWSALRVGRLNMDVPISLAILLAAGLSLYETAQSGENAYFDAALSLTFFLLAGRYLDHRTRAIARSAAEELAALEVPRATRLTESGEEVVPVAELLPGDRVRVVPGARVPVDGVVVEGESELDRALITGESDPVFAGPEAQVTAGEVNLTGPLVVRVQAAGQNTVLHRLAELVALSENARNRYTSLADRAAQIYAPLVHVLALVAGIGWYIATGDARLSIGIAVAVLIITCPCALGLAVPAVTTAASGRLFRKGVLLKSPTAIERLAEATDVVFDKTGTLTLGNPRPDDLAGVDPQALAVARALAQASAHPLGRALAAAIAGVGVKPAPVTEISELPGHGVRGLWKGQEVRLGRAEWLGAEPGARTATWLDLGGSLTAFTFTDALRPGAAEAVAALRDLGLGVKLLSGDSPGAVERIAGELGITDWQAGVLPEDKARIVQEMGAAGARVLM
ncbi:MAG TPA: heavy metal translocating P-type ATPase, partial [Aliiroseovarius sp.]|nr:heavy metal translocating P-type ATPase [Aliiroseovarius sp.]